MIDYAMKYLERGFTPIPLYSPSLLEKGIAPKWYEEKRKEIVQPENNNAEAVNDEHKKNLLRKLDIEACKESVVDINSEKWMTPVKRVIEWFMDYPGSNIGLMIGIGYNLTIVDVDKRIASEYYKRENKPIYAPIVETARGFHYYFTHSSIRHLHKTTEDTKINLFDGVGYVVAPPSVNGTNHVYQWKKNHSIFEIDVLKSNPWLKQTILGFLNNVEIKTKADLLKVYSCL